MTQRLDPDQLRALRTKLLNRVETKDRALVRSNPIIEKLTPKLAILKRHKFARRSEQLTAVLGKLLDELIDSGLAALSYCLTGKS